MAWGEEITLSDINKAYQHHLKLTPEMPASKLLSFKRIKSMIKVIMPQEIDDAWYQERNLDRMKCNDFVLQLEFKDNDGVAISRVREEYKVSHEDATLIFLKALQDQLASLDFLEKVQTEG